MLPDDYRTMIRQKFDARVRSNPQYSLRAFARDLNLSAPRISAVLNFKRGLSVEAAYELSQRLGLSKAETIHFCDLVQQQHGTSAALRGIATLRLQSRKRPNELKKLTDHDFAEVSEWYHFAIVELAGISGARTDPKGISSVFGISEAQAKVAIEALQRVGLLEVKDGKLFKSTNCYAVMNEIPSPSIRAHNKQLLDKAKVALEHQALEEREFNTLTCAIDPTIIPKVKKKIRAFRDELEELVQQGKPTQIYAMGIQFFQLSQKERTLHEQGN